MEVFIEPFLPAPQLIICGVSPAAAAVASIGHVVGFEVVVVDALATPEDFPTASVVVDRIDPTAYPASRERFAIVATHGLWDEEALRQVLALETSYVSHGWHVGRELRSGRERLRKSLSESLRTLFRAVGASMGKVNECGCRC